MSSTTRNTQVKREKFPINGWINLDKPYDMTSTQAVSAIKRLLHPLKIGHAGTLDPLATGVLPLALGEATKTVQYLMDATKIYQFTIAFGEQTDTDDKEGDVIKRSDNRPSTEAIAALLPHYLGEIEQLPPAYSAIKINGERAYDLARAGEKVELQPRTVRIDRFEIIDRPDADHVVCEVECGKGTYVRSLARDIAGDLGSCGHISALRRTRVGSFTEQAAISLDELAEYANNPSPSLQKEWLDPVERALDDIPAVTLDQVQAQRIRQGQSCFVSATALGTAPATEAEPYAGIYQAYHAGYLLALVQRRGRSLSPVRMFNLY